MTTLNDRFVLEAMKARLKARVSEALAECEKLATELTGTDGGQVLADLRDQFDPSIPTSAVQDLLSDAFFAHLKACPEPVVGISQQLAAAE